MIVVWGLSDVLVLRSPFVHDAIADETVRSDRFE